MFFYLILFCLGFISFSLKWKSIINMLLSLEVFMLILMYYSIFYFIDLTIFYFIIIILISEAVLGLSLLIMSIRFFGNDLTINFIW